MDKVQRRSVASDLRQSGMTYREVGEEMGVSRQRAHAMCTEEKPSRRMRLAAEGRCEQCECVNLNAGHRHCAPCAQRLQDEASIRCTRCREPRVSGKTMCEEHLAASRAVYYDRRTRGLCTACKAPAAAGMSLCSDHYFVRHAVVDDRREAGLCLACGRSKPKEGRARCERCLSLDNARSRRRWARNREAAGGVR